MTVKKIEIGDVFPTNGGGSVTVIEYKGSKNILVKHNDKHEHQAVVNSNNLRRGEVKNPYLPVILNIGFMGVGKFKSKKNGKVSIEYAVWVKIIDRCYNPEFHVKFPTYADCKLCDEWRNFQVFAEWYTSNKFYGLGYQIDKDILSNGKGKEYSPENCTLVPLEINSLILDRAAKRGEYPIGVNYDKSRGNFFSSMNIRGKTKNLGRFHCPALAHKAYLLAKESHVKDMAEEYRGRVDDRVYDALMLWKVA